MFKIDELKRFVIDWNNKHPLDAWWRKKHNIGFGTSEHKESDFIFQRIEFEEDKLINESRKGVNENDEKLVDDLQTDGLISENEKNTLNKKIVKMNQKDIDNEFENLDISQFNETVKQKTGNEEDKEIKI